jgi:lysozyme
MQFIINTFCLVYVLGGMTMLTSFYIQNTAPDGTPLTMARVADPIAKPEFLSLRTGERALTMIKRREGLRLDAYRGPGGHMLIGYGHALDVEPGMSISEAEANKLFEEDLRIIEKRLSQIVGITVSDNEFGALVSLAYNIGTGALAQSNVVRELNAGNRIAAADAFLSWDKTSQAGELIPSKYLADARSQERKLFLGEYDQAGFVR